MSGMPTLRIDDILVHPRDNDLIVGTHGRGLHIIDDITPLQAMSEKKVLDTEVTVFDVRPGTIWQNDTRLSRYWGGAKLFRGTNPAPGTAISYYLKSASGEVKITISDYSGKVVRNMAGPGEVGLNRVQWNLRGDPPPRPPGGGGFGGGGGGGGGGGAGGGGGGGGGGFGGLFNIGLPLEAGTYNVKLTVNGKDYTTKAVIENDPGM